MLVIGLTGSIGMGKSTAAAAFRAHGVAVSDADAEVHKLYDVGGAAVEPIGTAFAGVVDAVGRVDRVRLAAALLVDPSGFKRLEAIVHPLVRAAQRAFLHAEAGRGAHLAVLEIPLLFETHGEERVDKVVVVSAGPEAQRQRVLARPGMTAEKLEQLLSRQLPDAEKRRRADFVVDTNGTIAETQAGVARIVARLAADPEGTAFRRHWS